MQETWVRSPGQEESPGEKKWLPTPVFLPGKSHGWKSLAGYTEWHCKESDTIERLTSTYTHLLPLDFNEDEGVRILDSQKFIVREEIGG